ncbi:hypothetical protein VTJ04DRAFT_4720 [Mycothermus thermophilus]|uniref:uncharacterized protein n=1 Tax=Humicola insolens TaxID=85995 RepID=UPI003742D1FE
MDSSLNHLARSNSSSGSNGASSDSDKTASSSVNSRPSSTASTPAQSRMPSPSPGGADDNVKSSQPADSTATNTTMTITTTQTTTKDSNPTTTKATTTTTTTTTITTKRVTLLPTRWTDPSSVRRVSLREARDAAMTLAHAFAADDYARYLVDVDPEPVAWYYNGDSGQGQCGCGSCAGTPGSDAGGSDSGAGERRGSSSSMDSAATSATVLTAKEEARRWRLHVDILAYTVAAHCMGGLVTAVGPEFDSVAVWIPPGKNLDGWWTHLRSGLWRLHFELSVEGRRRYYDEILPLLHDTKTSVLGPRDADAWYLVYLGTKPGSQGKGYAARLLRDVMAKADAENRPMYLESSSAANNAYYEKFGFRVQRDIYLQRGSAPVRLSIMVREPCGGSELSHRRHSTCQASMASSSPSPNLTEVSEEEKKKRRSGIRRLVGGF